jgi:hypothetical protein
MHQIQLNSETMSTELHKKRDSPCVLSVYQINVFLFLVHRYSVTYPCCTNSKRRQFSRILVYVKLALRRIYINASDSSNLHLSESPVSVSITYLILNELTSLVQ